MSSLSFTDPTGLMAIFLGLFLGAVLKGATGAGLPIIAIPTIAAVYDVRVAVVLLVIPNFMTNALQVFQFKSHKLDNHFALHFALAGFIGAGIGTLLLAYLPLTLLTSLIAIVVFLYVILKLLRPEFQLAMQTMQRWVFVAGTSAGILQGAVGLSSPIAITFLHAGKLPRASFIYIVSLFFAGMSVIQVPLQSALGLMTLELVILSTIAMVPIMIGLPIGEHIGRKLSSIVFDRVLLLMLSVLAIKMLLDVVLSSL